jgi:hypothetical protein
MTVALALAALVTLLAQPTNGHATNAARTPPWCYNCDPFPFMHCHLAQSPGWDNCGIESATVCNFGGECGASFAFETGVDGTLRVAADDTEKITVKGSEFLVRKCDQMILARTVTPQQAAEYISDVQQIAL